MSPAVDAAVAAVNVHNGWVPRDFWFEEWEKQAIIGFHLNNPPEGYPRLTFITPKDMLVDRQHEIHAERDRKLEAARNQRQIPRHLAIKFLGSRERAMLTDYPMDALDLDYEAALKRIPDPGNVTQHLARTKYVDTTLEESLRDGVRQIVILGAGFDSRGYRFRDRLRDVRFFEVDYGPIQEYKKQRVKEVLGGLLKHVRYIAMDFTKDDLLTQLRKGGYSEKLKSLFVWEGCSPSSGRWWRRFIRRMVYRPRACEEIGGPIHAGL